MEATIGHRKESDHRRWAERLVSAGRAVGYGVLAWTAVAFALGAGKSKAEQQQTLTARALSYPGGRWLVVLVGLAVLIGAVWLAWYGITAQFTRHLTEAGPGVRTLGRVGYPGKAIAYGVVGFLIIAAAVTFDTDKSRGLDAAMRTLAGHSYGRVLLLLVAVGIAVYGVYAIAQARLRKI